MQCGLFSASLTTATAPGPCLNRVEVELRKGGAEWIEIPLSVTIENPGWHFLEFSCTGSLCIFEQENAPVGLLFHQAKKLTKAGISNPYSEFSPKTSLEPAPSSAPLIEVFPKQKAYLPENLTNGPICGFRNQPISNTLNSLNFIGRSLRKFPQSKWFLTDHSNFSSPLALKSFKARESVQSSKTTNSSTWMKLGTGRNCSKSPIIRLPIASTTFRRSRPKDLNWR